MHLHSIWVHCRSTLLFHIFYSKAIYCMPTRFQKGFKHYQCHLINNNNNMNNNNNNSSTSCHQFHLIFFTFMIPLSVLCISRTNFTSLEMLSDRMVLIKLHNKNAYIPFNGKCIQYSACTVYRPFTSMQRCKDIKHSILSYFFFHLRRRLFSVLFYDLCVSACVICLLCSLSSSSSLSISLSFSA